MIQTVPQKDDKFSEFILPDQYIVYSPVNADITGFSGERLIAFDRLWMKSVYSVIEKNYPEKAKSIWHKAGLEWGQTAYSIIENLSKTVFPNITNIQDLGMEQFETLFTNHIASNGWGNFELKRRDQFLFVDLYDSLIVDIMKDNEPAGATSPVCHIYAGFFAGIFSMLSKMELGCVEITCQANGYEHCSFLLDNPDTVAQVEQRIQAGMTPLDAFEKVKKDFIE